LGLLAHRNRRISGPRYFSCPSFLIPTKAELPRCCDSVVLVGAKKLASTLPEPRLLWFLLIWVTEQLVLALSIS
jgi:hypothetical protein